MVASIDERALVAAAIADMPVCGVEEVWEGTPRVNDQLLARVFETADALLKQRDQLSWQKMRGLQALDDYNTIDVAHGDLMFLLRLEYGRWLGGESRAPSAAKR